MRRFSFKCSVCNLLLKCVEAERIIEPRPSLNLRIMIRGIVVFNTTSCGIINEIVRGYSDSQSWTDKLYS